MHAVAQTLRQIEGQLNTYFLEREDAIRACLLAILAKEHVFLLGPPGVGKSQLIRAIVGAIVGARYFECGLSKNRPREAVIGPLDILEFRKNGNYFYKRTGFASAVEFVFLDEIGKMSPVLGHDLLPLLNERLVHEVNGGRSVSDAPLYTAFTAANEHITGESDDAAALYDRLLFRVVVDDLQEKANFMRLLRGGSQPVTATVDFPELQKVVDVEVPAIGISDTAMEAMVRLRASLASEHIYLSPRRWKQTLKALKAQAFLEGRTEILDEDLAVLRWTLWDTVEQIEKVERLCLSASNPFVDELFKVRSQIRELAEGIADRTSGSNAISDDLARVNYGKEVNKKLKIARESLDRLLKTAAGRSIPNFKEVADFHRDTVVATFRDLLGTTEDEAQIATARRLGLGDGTDVE